MDSVANKHPSEHNVEKKFSWLLNSEEKTGFILVTP